MRPVAMAVGHLALSAALLAAVYVGHEPPTDYAVGVSNAPLTPLAANPALFVLLVLQLPLVAFVPVLGSLSDGASDAAGLAVLGTMAVGNAALWALGARALRRIVKSAR